MLKKCEQCTLLDLVYSFYLQYFDEGQQTVLQCPLVVRVENQRLQQLQDNQNIAEEGQMVLLPDLPQVQVDATMQECSDHGQVSGKTHKKTALLCIQHIHSQTT